MQVVEILFFLRFFCFLHYKFENCSIELLNHGISQSVVVKLYKGNPYTNHTPSFTQSTSRYFKYYFAHCFASRTLQSFHFHLHLHYFLFIFESLDSTYTSLISYTIYYHTIHNIQTQSPIFTMHSSTAFLPLTLLVSYASAQTTSAAVPTALATGASGACRGQNVLDACLSSTTAIANACQSTDYTCLCTSWNAVLTYVFFLFFLSPSSILYPIPLAPFHHLHNT